MNKKQKLMTKLIVVVILAFPLILWLDSVTFGGTPRSYFKATIVELIIFIVGLIMGVMFAKAK